MGSAVSNKVKRERSNGVRRSAWLAVLCRFLRHTGGNTLMLTAAAMIPLAGMVGGGLDMARLYIAKTRLQHACDAGALAGRKSMGAGTWAQNNNAANAAALQFFRGNFTPGQYGSTGEPPTFTENAGKVTGTASVDMSMTLMKIFGFPTKTLTVTCDAEMRLPNTDVMFVLDTTGSMASPAVSTDTDTKIQALKTAVKCFYEIVARLDTNAICTTGIPSGGTGDQVQIRFGFMPYSTNVNVGKLLPTAYFADTWKYQTRTPEWTTTTTTTWGPVKETTAPPVSVNGSWSAWSATTFMLLCGKSSGTSTSMSTSISNSNEQTNGLIRTSTTTTIVTTTTTQTEVTPIILSCNVRTRTKSDTVTTVVTRTSIGTPVTTKTFSQWRYWQLPVNTGLLKNGTVWNDSMTLPIGANGSDQPVDWDGCIEERKTEKQSSYATIPSGAKDMNIDLIPTASDPESLWGQALPDATFLRKIAQARGRNLNQGSRDEELTPNDYWNGVSYYCPTEAKKLQQWPDATAFQNYVDGLVPSGNTYHDIGMIWGARFMSPTGIFASENATTPRGGEIQRNMIYMTDGDAVAQPCDYTAYGVAWWDRRTTDDVGTQSNCSGIDGGLPSLNAQVNARLDGLCTAVKNKEITLWVISFGDGSNAATEARLRTCASNGRFFTARNSATLQATFKAIADQISQLRLTS